MHEFIMIKDKELISVIVPVFNIENYLPRCLETIAAQTYQNLEIILVDDGSTDSSGKICDDFAVKDQRARVIHQSNSKLWAARNAGKKVAHGEYIIFVDGDDYLHVDAIKILHWAINQKDGYSVAVMDFKETSHQNESICSAGDNILEEVTKDDLVMGLFVAKQKVSDVAWNKLYRSELIKDMWFSNLARFEDADFNLRIYLKIDKLVSVKRILYFYMQVQGSLMHSPEHVMLNLESSVDSLYHNYLLLTPNDNQQYGHLLLKKMRARFILLKIECLKEQNKYRLADKYKDYIDKTSKDYWLSGKIPLYEKLGIAILLHSPRLACWLIKAVNIFNKLKSSL